MKRQAKIFIVEDDQVLTKVLVWQLEKLGYIVCGCAVNGEEALEKITGSKPDLVLLDIELEGRMDGIDVGKVLSNRTEIPFVYLTSHTEKQMLQRARTTVPEGYLGKPFDAEQLRITIEMALIR